MAEQVISWSSIATGTGENTALGEEALGKIGEPDNQNVAIGH